MKCDNCGSEFQTKSYLCLQCGKLLDKEMFQNAELVNQYEMRMQEAIQKILSKKSQNISWDATVDKYVRTMEKMDALLAQSEFPTDNHQLKRRIASFVDRCSKPEFHIAFVGTIKAGKSTLINALLGKNYASTSVTPETAVLTKFRHCETGNYIRIYFYTQDEWGMLWESISQNADVFKKEYAELNAEAEKEKWLGHQEIYVEVSEDELEGEIEKWTSSKKAAHYFVREVEIGLSSFAMPPEVVFVDTPGLDDAVRYRSDVTRQYIDRANAVFACVKSDALTGPELQTIYRIFSNTSYNPEKVYIIGTQWDTLNNPGKDWEIQKKEWVKYLSDKNTYGSVELAKRNITYAAAYINNLARDYEELNDDENWAIQSIAFKFRIRPNELESKLADLIDMSNVSEIERHIQQDLVSKYKDYLYKDIEGVYLDIKGDLKKYFMEIRETEQEIIDTSSKDIATIRQEFAKAEDELKKVEMYRKQLTDTLKLVKEDTDKRIKELTQQLQQLVS